MTGITDHLAEIRARMAEGASTVASAVANVTLVAVSKGHPRAAVESGLAAGLRDFGENYLQEALPKMAPGRRDAVWHFIGWIQSNKTREIAVNFDWAQTVTSARIAERLSAWRPHHGEPLQVCIQLKPRALPPADLGQAGPGRGGCPGADVPALADLIDRLPRLRLRGLMLLPRSGLAADALRAEFRAARTLFDELIAGGHVLDTLSMGMSDDLEMAIEEGSTMIRVGTALFGERP